ncbi:MAG: hypothetical protein DRI74_03005 [Bacteroidetes bacterium]|nr:MAG: hypothetical protein DRI74_03005 [Bacteroidota bacterium]
MLAPTKQEIITFDGLIDTLNVVEILNDIELKAEEMGVSNSLRKKIFNIAVEELQNLLHHTRDFSVKGEPDDKVRVVQFSFSEEEDFFLLKTSNFLLKKHLKIVEEKINFVNKLSKGELKELYRKVLTNNQISDKGGAGLGFIDMRRKSGLDLIYDVEYFDNDLARFTFLVKINKKKDKG